MNRFGGLFLEFDDGTIRMFDVGGGTLTDIECDRSYFHTLIGEGDNANQWLIVPLVDKLVSAGIVPEPGHCYGYRQPPVLGGEYTAENVKIRPIVEHYSNIHEQIENAVDNGTVVTFEVSKCVTFIREDNT